MSTKPAIQPELDRAFSAALAVTGITGLYRRGTAAPDSISAILGHPNQYDLKALGQSIILKVRLADFIGTNSDPGPIPGDFMTIGTDIYRLYLVNADAVDFADLYLQHT